MTYTYTRNYLLKAKHSLLRGIDKEKYVRQEYKDVPFFLIVTTSHLGVGTTTH